MTPFQLQAIVDNECSPADRARWLTSLENEPSQWKTLALALLEEQQWASAIRMECIAEKAADTIGSGLTTRSMDPLGEIAAESRQGIGSIALAPKDLPLSKSIAKFFPVLAASILLGLGFYFGAFLRQYQGDTSLSPSNGLAIDVPSMSKGSPIRNVDSTNSLGASVPLRMVFDGPDSTQTEIPLYDVNDVNPDMLFARNLREMQEIEAWNKKMRPRGFELEMQPEYYTGQLEDGRQVVIPVRQVGLRPIGL